MSFNKGALLPCVILVALTALCDAVPTVQRRGFKVYRGHEIMDWQKNEFKYVVLIMDQGFCTGSIYNGLNVLTASHCASQLRSKKAKVEVERINNKIPRTRYFYLVDEFISNPAYHETAEVQPINGYDVAVVTLEEKIYVDRFGITIPQFMTSQGITVNYGTTVYIVGYGREREKNDRKGQLRWGKQTYVKCANPMPGDPVCTIPEAKFNFQDTDVGDSGGPLVHKPKQGNHLVMGTLSGGEEMEDGSFNVLYGSLRTNEKFILKNIKK